MVRANYSRKVLVESKGFGRRGPPSSETFVAAPMQSRAVRCIPRHPAPQVGSAPFRSAGAPFRGTPARLALRDRACAFPTQKNAREDPLHAPPPEDSKHKHGDLPRARFVCGKTERGPVAGSLRVGPNCPLRPSASPCACGGRVSGTASPACAPRRCTRGRARTCRPTETSRWRRLHTLRSHARSACPPLTDRGCGARSRTPGS